MALSSKYNKCLQRIMCQNQHSDRISGKVTFGAHSGPARYLTGNEEDKLVNFLTGCSAIEHARSKQQVLALIRRVLSQNSQSGVISTGWFEGFKYRHPKLTLGKPEKLLKTVKARVSQK